MDARQQQLTPPLAQAQMPRVWKPQSRIAAYIKGNIKLEDIVSRDKLVRPEERHNKRPAFLALVNDEDAVAAVSSSSSTKQTKHLSIKSEPRHHQSTISQCLSISSSNTTATTKTSAASFSSTSRVDGASVGAAAGASIGGQRRPHHHRRLTIDELTRTIVEKNECITALREQLDTLRNCASIQNTLLLLEQQHSKSDAKADEEGDRAENDGDDDATAKHSRDEGQQQQLQPLQTVVDRMLECLLDMLTTLRHHDEHDERMAQFVTAVRRERENVLRSVEALCRDCARNERLKQQLRHYEQKYEQAIDELRRLGELSERIRSHIVADKRMSDNRLTECRAEAVEYREALEALRATCDSLKIKEREATTKLAEVEERHAQQLERMRREGEAIAKRLQTELAQREEEALKWEQANAELKEKNTELLAQLQETQHTKRTIGDKVARLRVEKEKLAQESAEWERDRHEIWPRANQNHDLWRAFQDTNWYELKKCVDKTGLRAGLLEDGDIR